MGLFVGGSVISLFELIDVFLYNQIYMRVKVGKRGKRNKSVDGESIQNNECIKDATVYNDLDTCNVPVDYSNLGEIDRVTRV
jgi:hypothetical protein